MEPLPTPTAPRETSLSWSLYRGDTYNLTFGAGKTVLQNKSDSVVIASQSNKQECVTKAKHRADWSVEDLHGKPTTQIYRDPVMRTWTPDRAELHEKIINDLLMGKLSKENPKLWVVMGGVGSGKSTLIKSELEPNHPGAVVIDADRLWSRIPEYEDLAIANWRTAGELTYAEVRHLRDAALTYGIQVDVQPPHSGKKSGSCMSIRVHSA